MSADTYQPLTIDSLPQRLGALPVLTDRLGDAAGWRAREVGDGNLNLVFIVEGAGNGAVVKQALPYVRLVGESWPLPLRRSFFEAIALDRQARRDPGAVPEVWHFDEPQALIVMEFLTPHIILRRSLIDGRRHEGVGAFLGRFCARTAFRGSDLALPAADRKADVALFAGNVELCDITENLVFTDPYFDAKLNHFTSALAPLVARLRADGALKIAAQELKADFTSCAETLMHGDLHTGSVMVHGSDAKVIDPEFAAYGPFGFDVGMLISNFLMAHLSQPGHSNDADFGEWLLDETAAIWTAFRAEFTRLWRTERRGMLYPDALFDAQGDELAAEAARLRLMDRIRSQAVGVCGVELHRRIVGLAHNADFETIADEGTRAACEARALELGRILAVQRGHVNMDDVIELARTLNGRDCL